MNPMKPKSERKFVEVCQKYPEETQLSLPGAPQEGFEYLFSSENAKFSKFQMLKEKFANLSVLKAFLKHAWSSFPEGSKDLRGRSLT